MVRHIAKALLKRHMSALTHQLVICLSILCRDDAVFHDRAAGLVSEYWAHVPRDFQFVYAGHLFPDKSREELVIGGHSILAS